MGLFREVKAISAVLGLREAFGTGDCGGKKGRRVLSPSKTNCVSRNYVDFYALEFGFGFALYCMIK